MPDAKERTFIEEYFECLLDSLFWPSGDLRPRYCTTGPWDDLLVMSVAPSFTPPP